MTQLIINEIECPFTSQDKYSAHLKELGESRRTIGGRLVTEIRGYVWVVSYAYDYMGSDLMRPLLAALRGPGELTVAFLTPDADELISGTFKCTSLPASTVAWKDSDAVYWHNISFTLESVDAVEG